MQEIELKNLKLNFVNSISTIVIAFVSFVGLILALTEFLQTRKEIFGFGWSIIVIITFIFVLISIILISKRWMEK